MSKSPSVAELVDLLRLKPHPEGGFYAETYRSDGAFGNRSYSTAIYFLLPAGHKSHLHRIKSDEMWHWYLGGPLHVVELREHGAAKDTLLGPDLMAGQRPQYVVRHDTWFGSYPDPSAPYALVGCTVSPGFDFADFELGTRNELLKAFPQARALIEKLT